MTTISDVIAPIWRNSRPRYRLVLDVPVSAPRRLERRAGRTDAAASVATSDLKVDACLTGRLGTAAAGSLTAVGCDGTAWKSCGAALPRLLRRLSRACRDAARCALLGIAKKSPVNTWTRGEKISNTISQVRVEMNCFREIIAPAGATCRIRFLHVR